MVRIGIEINNILRDLNTSILKFYVKGIDKNFDETTIDKNVTNVANSLPFKTKRDRYNFFYIDYPYEVYGTAKCMSKNLAVYLNNWMVKMDDIEKNKYDVKLFSLYENALTIQSTYFFLSKIGSRVRKMFYPKDGRDMWNECDIIITTNKRIVETKPADKIVVLIKKNDNLDLVDKADYVYNSLDEIIDDEKFLKIEPKKTSSTSIFDKIMNNLKKYFNI